MLSERQRRFWKDFGYLVLPSFASDTELDGVTRLLSRVWEERHPRVVVDDLVTGRRTWLRDADVDASAHSFKVNDLYLEFDAVRQIALSERITRILGGLLSDAPVLVNSLNFERGSQQPYHVDSLYMTPATIDNLAAIWVALEDCHPDSGPLAYYPESHRIPPFQFSDGGHHTVPDEMDTWQDYEFSEVERRGLEPQHFAAHRGDVFIWSSNLLHGGSPIIEPSQTRHSLVCHYWTAGDCRSKRLDLVRSDQGYWFRRGHQSIPGDDSASVPSRPEEDQAATSDGRQIHRWRAAARFRLGRNR